MDKFLVSQLIDTMSNIEYGLLLAIAINTMLVFAITFINPRNKLNVLSYIVAIVMLAPLTFQLSNLIGACQASNSASEISNIIGVFSPTLSKYVSEATTDEIKWYVFRRVMWSILFIIITAIAVYYTSKIGQKGQNRSSSRHERSGYRHSSGRRVSRRR